MIKRSDARYGQPHQFGRTVDAPEYGEIPFKRRDIVVISVGRIYGDTVVACMQQPGHLKTERIERPFVVAHRNAVDSHIGLLAHCLEA